MASGRIHAHLRSNVVGYLALFCFAISGVAEALPGRNSVDSGDIRNAQVRLADLAPDSVDSSKVVDDSLNGGDIAEATLDIDEPGLDPTVIQRRVSGACLTGEAIRTVAQDGSVTCESTAGGLPSGAVPPGGDLAGSYPSPVIGADAVGSDEIADDTVTGADISDASGAGTITDADLADDSVAAAEIAAGQVGSSELGAAAVQPRNLDLLGCQEVAAEESTTSSSFTDLATPGPSVTVQVPSSGLVAFWARATLKSSVDGSMTGAGADVRISDSVAGAFTTKILSELGTTFMTRWTHPGFASNTNPNTGVPFATGAGWSVLELSPGAHTLSLKYGAFPGDHTATFRNRKLCVMAIG